MDLMPILELQDKWKFSDKEDRLVVEGHMRAKLEKQSAKTKEEGHAKYNAIMNQIHKTIIKNHTKKDLFSTSRAKLGL